MTNIPDGYEKLPGRSTANARKAIDLAVKNGFNARDVLTARDGYLIPFHAAKATYVDDTELAAGDDGIPVAEAKTPDSGWKNADIVQYAEDNSIDLGGATKKDDMLAAIAAARNKEE